MKRILKNNASLATMLIVVVAMAFMFSCSSDSNDVCGDNFPELPKQVYLDGKEYNGDGDVWLKGFSMNDHLPACKIKNGKITLNLPNIDNRFVTRNPFKCDDDYDIHCESNVSYPPNLLVSRWASEPITIISGKECYLQLKSSDKEIATFLYASESGEVKGTLRLESYSSLDITIYDMNLSKGWNVVYGTGDVRGNANCNDNNGKSNCEAFVSTDSKIIKGELKWQAFCYDD
jgi:hypothetical protein